MQPRLMTVLFSALGCLAAGLAIFCSAAAAIERSWPLTALAAAGVAMAAICAAEARDR